MYKVLTIVVPTYNMEKYLDRGLSSLIISDENMRKLEVLVVNDGSKDRSSEIAHFYEQRYPNTFRVIDKENGNYGSCVNRGLQEATGKYIKILDADDWFDTEVLDLFISYLLEVDADLIISDYKVVDAKGDVSETYNFKLPTDHQFGLDELSEGTITWLWHQGITYKTEKVRAINYQQTEGISYTDDEWIYAPMVKVQQICYFPHYLYLYLRGREGQTFDPTVLKKTFASRVIVVKKLLEYYQCYRDKVDKEIRNYLFVKFIIKLTTIYNFYLIKESSAEGNKTIHELDSLIKDKAPEIFNSLGAIHNKLGWYYIQDWRNSGYKKTTVRLQIQRWKFKLKCFLGKSIDINMPSSLKRIP